MGNIINAAIIQDRKVLLVKEKDKWILPEGRPVNGESEPGCLMRELYSFLPETKISNLTYYESFNSMVPKNEPIVTKTYFGEIDEEINIKFRKNDAKFATAEEIDSLTVSEDSLTVSEMTLKIITHLKEIGRIGKKIAKENPSGIVETDC